MQDNCIVPLAMINDLKLHDYAFKINGIKKYACAFI